MVTTPTALVIDGLTFRYPGAAAPAISDVSLSICAGERVALLGSNGSGKTTLILHINGIFEPDAGSITVGGLPLHKQTQREVRRRVGLVFQDADDQLFMQTVADDVAFGPANLGVKGSELSSRVEASLAAAGAEALADRTPHHLSGGEKKRVAIATVLAMQPELLILDEPTASLDPVGRRKLAELLATLQQTQIIVTHDLPFALATCERSIVLSSGRLVADRPTADLLADTELLADHELELPFGFTPPS